MHTEDEHYVRVYTRDTPNWLLLSWESRALLVLTMRKLDKLGTMELGGHGLVGLAVVVGMPADVVERAMPPMLANGTFTLSADGLLCMPNYIDAQYCKTSTKHRMQAYRERKRSLQKLLQGNLDNIETADSALRSVTPVTPVTQRNTTHSNATQSKTPHPSGGSMTVASGASVQLDMAAGLGLPSTPPSSSTRLSRGGKATSHHVFIEAFTAAFTAAHGAAPEWGQKQCAIVKRLLKKPGGLNDALARMERMFDVAPRWPAENPDIQTLAGHWDKFARPVRNVKTGRAEPHAHEDFTFGEEKL